MTGLSPTVLMGLLSLTLSGSAWPICFGQPAPGQPQIVGVVLDSSTNLGIASAGVQLFAGDVLIAETATDESGRFALERPSHGWFHLQAQFHGYSARFAGSQDLLLLKNAAFNTGSITLFLTRTAVITGRVADSQGNPRRGIKVIALQRRGPAGRADLAAPEHIAYTDDRGMYRLFDLLPGVYSVACVPDESEIDAAPFAPVYFSGEVEPERAEYFLLTAGETRDGVDLVLRETAAVELSGIVSNVPPEWGGRQVAVAVLSSSGLHLPLAVTQVESGGVFHFRGLPAGDYHVVAWGPIIGRGANGPFAEARGKQGGLSVRLGASDVSEFVVELHDMTEVGGSLRSEAGLTSSACGGAKRVVLRSLHGPLPTRDLSAAVSDSMAGGLFRISGVPPGRYKVDVSGLSSRCYLREVWAEDRLLESREIDVARALTLKLVLSDKAGSVSGIVTLAEGVRLRPRFIALVSVGPIAESNAEVRVGQLDADGHFRLQWVAPGDYELSVVSNTDFLAVFDPVFREKSSTIQIHLKEGESVQKIIEVLQ